MDETPLSPKQPVAAKGDSPELITDDEQSAVIEYVPVVAPAFHPVTHLESGNNEPSCTVTTELAIDNKAPQLDDTHEIREANSSASERADTDQQVAISGKAVIQQALIKLLGLARREVLIIFPSLHDLFDDEQISRNLLDFVRDSPKRDVLILLNNLADQQASNHQLVKLAQRISSRVQLKQTASLLETPVMDSDYLVVIDRSHILRIDDIEKYSAWFDINYPSRAQQYAASMLQQWPRAREIAEFRQIIL